LRVGADDVTAAPAIGSFVLKADFDLGMFETNKEIYRFFFFANSPSPRS
jgi:hypothetical protein